MRYQFIAEFYPEKVSGKPVYKTHLWGVEDGKTFIKEHGFTEVPGFDQEYPEYMKEMEATDVAVLFQFFENSELAEIILDGKPCQKAVIYASLVDDDYDIRLDFGVEQTHWAHFSGNGRDSRVRISEMYADPVVDLPLKSFKEKLGVKTLFEVMEKLEKYFHTTSLEDIQKTFESGFEKAIDIVVKEFNGELDLDGNPQLLHMTAVAEAGKNKDEILAGILHDLVEDTYWTFEDLLKEGFPVRIVDTLRLLTHSKETPYMDYIRNICESGNKIALAVKINDLNHNLKRGRAGGHWQHVAKHEKALAYIQEYIETQQ